MQSTKPDNIVPCAFEPIRESRFRQQLHESTEQNKKDMFRLLLSMVSQNALELDQFHVPETEQPQPSSDLHKQFFIQRRQVIGAYSGEQAIENNKLVSGGHRASVDLNLKLKPEPLVQDVYDLPAEIFDNLDFNARQRLLRDNLTEDPKSQVRESHADERPAVDVEAWFNVLQESRAYSQMN